MYKCLQKMIICMMICALFVPVTLGFAAEGVKTEKTYQNETALLEALGILDNEAEFDVEAHVTRAELSVLLSRLLGYDDIAGGTYANYFTDVASDHWAVGEIGLMSNLGIVNGFANGKFYPDEPVLFDHAVKMTISALGYNVIAHRRGGTIADYLFVANQIDLLDGITGNGGEAVTGGVVAKMLYNALFVDLLEEINYGEEFSYETQKGVNLLSEKFNTVKAKGQITATAFASLYEKEGAGEGKVKINGELYNCEVLSVEKWLGYEVVFFARYYDGMSEEGTVIYLVPDANKNDVITVEAADICEETTENTFCYYELPDYKRVSENIKNAYVIYNGTVATSYSDEDFKPDSGSVTLINTDGDKDYDIVSIVSYDTRIVNSVSANKITFKYNKEDILLDPENKKIDSTFIRNGEEIDYKEVAEWDVCTVKANKNKDRYEFYISDEKITGQVKGISEDFVTIGEKEYRQSASYKKAVSDPLAMVIAPEAGEDFTLLLDIFGRIAGTKREIAPQLGEGYGYLLDAKQETSGFAKEMYFKILTGEIGSHIVTYEAAEKFTVNDVRLEKIVDSPELFDAAERKIKKQLIVYETNLAGEITEIHTAVDKTGDTSYIGYSEEEFTLDHKFDRAPYRVGAHRSFQYNKYRVYKDTIVFIVPNIDDPLPEECRVTSADSYLKSDTYYSNVSLYDTRPDYNVSVMVTLVGTGAAIGVDSIDDGNQAAIVDKITTTVNSDGVVVPKFNGYYDGKYVSYAAAFEDLRDYGVWTDEKFGLNYNGTLLKDLPQGSIIQMEVNVRNEIVQMRVLYIPTEEKQIYFEKANIAIGQTDAGGRLHTAYGTVVKRLSDGVVYNARAYWEGSAIGADRDLDGTDRSWDRNVMTTTVTYVHLFDKEKEKITLVDLNELNSGDEIFLHKGTNGVRNIIIYR